MENKFKQYVGTTIGKLKILGIADYHQFNKTWLDCECECGTKRRVSASKLIAGSVKSCQKCKNRGSVNARWKGYQEISGKYLKNLRNGAMSRKGDKAIFEITPEYIWNLFIKQDRKCALSGLEISFASDSYSMGTASLDRIDSSKGYTEDNIQWVHKDVNKMKTDFAQDRFLELCKLINNNYETSNSS